MFERGDQLCVGREMVQGKTQRVLDENVGLSCESSDERGDRARAAAMRQSFGGGIILKADGSLLGGAGLHVRNWDARGFEIGYWLRVSATGQGYVREAAAALSRLAFESLTAERVKAGCSVPRRRASTPGGHGCGGKAPQDPRAAGGLEARAACDRQEARRLARAGAADWEPGSVRGRAKRTWRSSRSSRW